MTIWGTPRLSEIAAVVIQRAKGDTAFIMVLKDGRTRIQFSSGNTMNATFESLQAALDAIKAQTVMQGGSTEVHKMPENIDDEQAMQWMSQFATFNSGQQHGTA